MIPLIVGGLSAWVTSGSMERFSQLRKPPLSPPEWAFPVVWTALFLLMGFASYLVLMSSGPSHRIRRAMYWYAVQLVFNFCWSILFFNLSLYLAALVWLVILWFLILITAVQFYRLSRLAGALILPYLLWVIFAGYLNFFIYRLN
jgi:tryptophan-rich sensory protein